jgi:flagellar biosynthetic protein FlhB
LTAKGVDLVAAKIRLLAAEAGVPLKEEASLARALYQLEIGREIPESLYTEVAVVLEWVYSKAEERAGI